MQFERFDSVFDALADTLAESAGMQARFELQSALELRILSWGVSQQAVTSHLGIGNMRLYDLMHGQLQKFSLAALLELTAAAALAPVLKNEEPGFCKVQVARVKRGPSLSSAGQRSGKNI